MMHFFTLAVLLQLQVSLMPRLPQTAAPTIGDTIWLTRTVALPPGDVVRAADWDPADPIELLGRPRIVVTGDSAEVAYPVVIWRPGPQLIDLPGPLLLGPGGTVDSLPSERIRVEVKSVLPAATRASELKPQPRASLVAGQEVSAAPLALLWAVSLTLLLPLHLWWHRQGKPLRVVSPAPEPQAPPLARWADAGEYRAVANASAFSLRAVVSRRVAAAHPGLDTERLVAEVAAARPDWPLEELSDLLRSLDQARFGLTTAPEALSLARASGELRDRLVREAA